MIPGIILALDVTYAQEVIHRDVKPENFVFDNDGYLRYVDEHIRYHRGKMDQS